MTNFISHSYLREFDRDSKYYKGEYGEIYCKDDETSGKIFRQIGEISPSKFIISSPTNKSEKGNYNSYQT